MSASPSRPCSSSPGCDFHCKVLQVSQCLSAAFDRVRGDSVALEQARSKYTRHRAWRACGSAVFLVLQHCHLSTFYCHRSHIVFAWSPVINQQTVSQRNSRPLPSHPVEPQIRCPTLSQHKIVTKNRMSVTLSTHPELREMLGSGNGASTSPKWIGTSESWTRPGKTHRQRNSLFLCKLSVRLSRWSLSSLTRHSLAPGYAIRHLHSLRPHSCQSLGGCAASAKRFHDQDRPPDRVWTAVASLYESITLSQKLTSGTHER